jgi:hypothetical protein
MTRLFARLGSATALALLAACGGGGGVEPQIGPPASINISTSPSATSVVGSSAGVLAVKVVDATGKALSAIAVSFTATGGATTNPASATTDANGLAQTTVTLGTVAGPVTVTATVTGTALKADASITATAAPTAACITLPVGTLVTYSGVSTGCVSGSSAGGEFALVAYNSTPDGSSTLTATVTGNGLGTAPTTSLSPTSISASRMLTPLGVAANALVPDEAFHLRQMARARTELRGKAAGARAWYAARNAGGSTTLGGYTISPRRGVIPASPTMGQLVSVNVNGDDGCINARYRGARIAAVGTRSVVLADTLNPVGGFTDADYQRFADRFDNLVYPLDTDNFGTPSDIDGNGRVGILFTAAVNEMTPANSNSYVGGFFFARDLYPNTTQNGLGACAGSNVAEMFYMLVPDPQGKINGNVRRAGFVDTLTTGVLAHEFQHLINASRRLFVNTAGRDVDELTWLNEGLSHVAEELLYYRESGKQPRQNLSGDDVYTNSRSTYPFFKADAASNFSRLTSYLSSPGGNSPVIDNDDLATRGAAWSFLRYAADQVGGSEAAIWARFDNSTTSGFASLQYALGQDPLPLLRTWALANYLDDLGVGTDTHFQHLSWNFRSVYGTVFGSYDTTGTIFTPSGYPLSITRLADNATASVSVRGGSASYYRFAVGAGRDATLTFSSGGQAPGAALQFNVVRTK